MLTHISRGITFDTQGKSSLGLFERIRRHYVKRVARHQLYALDERMLHDIGISRSDIDRLTKG